MRTRLGVSARIGNGVRGAACPHSCPQGGEERPGSEDRHDPLQIVGQDLQAHLGGLVSLPSHPEVGRPHPAFVRPEQVLDRLAPRAHRMRIRVEPALYGFQDSLVLSPRHPPLLGRRAACLDRAVVAGRRPVAA